MMKEILSFKKEISAHTIIDQESVERHLEFLNKCYEEAADSDTNFIFDCQDTRGCYNLKSYPDNDSIMNFCGAASFFSFGRYERNRGFGFATNQTGEGVQAAGTKMTYEQACDKADEMMQTLFDVPFAIVNAKLISKINEWEFLWHDGRDTSLGEAYVFYYTREYDGIPSLYIEPAFKIVDDGTEFRRPFPREGAYIMVDDRGIINVTYQSFSHTVEKLNDNVKLMAFEDVLERFKRDIFNHRLWGVDKAEIDITRIEFGMVREPIKDKAEQYMMVPAWNFIGNINNGRFLEQDKSVLALSALNGSVITDYDFIFY